MNVLRKFYISIVAKAVWTAETLFFYPKLAAIYKELNLLTEDGNNLVIFDIGANKGQTARFFKNIYPDSHIYAFEPSTSSFTKLRSFIARKKYSGISIFQIALGASQREITFYESDLSETSTFSLPNSGSKYLKRKNRILLQKDKTSYKPTLMQITTLDHFVDDNEINGIDILKIDVEGFELEVIQGFSSSLEHRKVKILQIENQDNDMRTDNFLEIDSFLRERNFRLIHQIKHPFGNFREILYKLI
jgi:FkbM family methyltransferase